MDNREYACLIAKANAAIQNNEYYQAINFYQEAFKIQIYSSDFVSMCTIYIKMGAKETAYKLLKDAEKELYNDTIIKEALAFYYEDNGEIDEAIKYFKEISKLEPDDEQVIFEIARLYDEYKNDSETSTRLYQQVLEMNPNHYWSNINLGGTLEHNNQDDEALLHFKKAYDIDHTKPLVNYNIAVVFQKKGNLNDALAYYQEEIKYNPTHSLIYYNMAIIYKEQEQYDQSKYYYRKAISIKNDDYRYWYNLACVCSLTGDISDASDCLTYAKSLEPLVDGYIKEDPELENLRNNFGNKM